MGYSIISIIPCDWASLETKVEVNSSIGTPFSFSRQNRRYLRWYETKKDVTLNNQNPYNQWDISLYAYLWRRGIFSWSLMARWWVSKMWRSISWELSPDTNSHSTHTYCCSSLGRALSSICCPRSKIEEPWIIVCNQTWSSIYYLWISILNKQIHIHPLLIDFLI